jgi:hypothetical protein
VAHANKGWTCLHRVDPRAAQEHFREALRLDPELEFARQGMLEALKARNPVYRVMLAYFLWMGRQSGWTQWAVVIGVYFSSRFLSRATFERPEQAWVLVPVLVLFYLFVYLTWTARPLFNLLLRFDRFGRYVLSGEERRASTWFGACVAVAVACFASLLAGMSLVALAAGIGALVISVGVAATWAREGRARVILAVATAALALIGIAGIGALATGAAVAGSLVLAFFVGFLGLQILANVVER